MCKCICVHTLISGYPNFCQIVLLTCAYSPTTHLSHRAALRLFIVFKLRTGLLTTPSVPSPDRKRAQELVTNPQPPEGEGEREGEGEKEGEGKPLAWRAPRTGKVIRSIHAGQCCMVHVHKMFIFCKPA